MSFSACSVSSPLFAWIMVVKKLVFEATNTHTVLMSMVLSFIGVIRDFKVVAASDGGAGAGADGTCARLYARVIRLIGVIGVIGVVGVVGVIRVLRTSTWSSIFSMALL